jgi:nucleotide-binding universal stress UspA family protein
MFKRILLPIDGSELSAKAIRQAVAFATDAKAEVIGLFAAPGYHPVVYEDFVPPDFMSPQRHAAAAKKRAERILSPLVKACAKAGVTCRTRYVIDDSPYDAIIAAAKKDKCDLIVMASHGRRGIAGLLLGSETMKVLTHSSIPVLVLR